MQCGFNTGHCIPAQQGCLRLSVYPSPVGLLFVQMSLRCSEVAPGIRPNVEGEDGSDWCVVDAGMGCFVFLIVCSDGSVT